MRRTLLLRGALLLGLAATPAQAQETLLTTILKGALPGAQVTWSEGAGEAGVETYRDLFILHDGVRTRAEQLRVRTVDGAASIEATGLVINLDSDKRFALEIGSLQLRAAPGLLAAVSEPSRLLDLCAVGRAGAALEAGRIRLVRELPPETPGGRHIRSETRIERAEVSKASRATRSGCAVDLGLRVTDHQLVRSDQSGLSVIRYESSLTLPGNLATLASGEVPDLLLTGLFGGAEYRLPGGAAAATARDGTATLRIGSLSATPALTALLRTRGGTAGERVLAVINALIPARAELTGSVAGLILKPEDLIPAKRASGLSRGSLTNLIGDYRLSAQTEGGRISAEISSEVIGVGTTRFTLGAVVSPYPETRAALSWSDPALELLPPTRLAGAEIEQRDAGLLRAIELIAGFPVSVLAAIYIEEGVNEEPEPWRPALKRLAGDLARFFLLSLEGMGGRLTLTTPTDLTLQETIRLLAVKPELADQLYRIEVGPATD
jgi:hypothetical protein